MQLPHIHMNGTGAADLARQYLEVHKATYALKAALSNAAPHGRDYGATAIDTATKEWLAMVREVEAIQAWAESMFVHCTEER